MLLLLWRVLPVLHWVDYYTWRMRWRPCQLSMVSASTSRIWLSIIPDIPRLTSGTHTLACSNRVLSYDALDRPLSYRVSCRAGV